jgi:hypothetical protein
MTIATYEVKPDGTASGGVHYADSGENAVFLEAPTGVCNAIEAANPHKVKWVTGSLNFEEQLSNEQAWSEWELFRVAFIDPLGVLAWSRFHPKENKSNKPKPHSAIHFGVSTCLLDGRQITPFFGAARSKGRDFKALDLWKRLRNKLMGYSSPDDPAKWVKYRTRIKRNWPEERKDDIARLDSELRDQKWKNREEIIFWLQSAKRLKITRMTDTTVSIQHPYWPKPLRLEGYWWNKDWSKFHDPNPFVDRPVSELAADLELELKRRAGFFEKKYKFTQRKENNERTRAIESLISNLGRANQSPIPGRGRQPSGTIPGGNETTPGKPGTTISDRAKPDVGDRANLNEIGRTWSAFGKHLRAKLIEVEYDEEEFLTRREYEATVRKVDQLLNEVEEESAVQRAKQKPQPEPESEPQTNISTGSKDVRKKDDNPPI